MWNSKKPATVTKADLKNLPSMEIQVDLPQFWLEAGDLVLSCGEDETQHFVFIDGKDGIRFEAIPKSVTIQMDTAMPFGEKERIDAEGQEIYDIVEDTMEDMFEEILAVIRRRLPNSDSQN